MGCSSSHATAVAVNPLPQAADNDVPPVNIEPPVINDPPDENDPPLSPTDDHRLSRMEGALSASTLHATSVSSDLSVTAEFPEQESSRPEDTTTVGTNNNNPGKVGQSTSEPRDDASQERFQQALRSSCLLLKPEALLKCATKSVYKLVLPRALPHHIHLTELLRKLTGLQELDLSNNQMGPQAFRAVMLGLCHNSTIHTLKMANNQTDTDSAESVGKMLMSNKTLVCLDVSGNHLGTDYFSRCAGPAFSSNTSLSILRCEGIGCRDFEVLMNHLKDNHTLVELNLSHNGLSQTGKFVESLAVWLRNSDCHLEVLELKNMEMKGSDLMKLGEVMSSNQSLLHLNVSGNKVACVSGLLQFLVACVCHVTLSSLTCDNIKAETTDTWQPGEGGKRERVSQLQSLSMSNCSLEDTHISSLSSHLGAAAVPQLVELVLTDNPKLTSATLKDFIAMATGSLEKLTLALNPVDDLPLVLTSQALPTLRYLNLRKAKCSAATIGQLAPCVGKGGIDTLVLDGIKLSGSNALKTLLGTKCELVALSLAGCQLTDDDITPVTDVIQRGMSLHMLKLATNRITDAGIVKLVASLLKHKTHCLALADLMNNSITSEGAKKLCELFSGKRHKSNIHSLNLSNNTIGCDGVEALAAVVGKTSLTSLQMSNQQVTYEEEDMTAVYITLAKTLGWAVKEESGQMVCGCSDLPSVPPALTVRLQGLGGLPGQLGHLLDSISIMTDSTQTRLPSLTLQHALELSSFLKGQDGAECLLSSEEWDMIIGAKKDSPSWLQLAGQRDLAIYLSHLPASVTMQKMEGFLENEADCTVKEVCLMKDVLTRKNNGLCWVLMKDAVSLKKAVEFMNDGLAQVFSQPFLISQAKLKIDDAASSEAETKARHDMQLRMNERRKDEVAHQILIQESYRESQERHAYRLAHPAYADGRIW